MSTTERAHFAATHWTDLTRFYGRLGAFVWRAYQRAEVPA